MWSSDVVVATWLRLQPCMLQVTYSVYLRQLLLVTPRAVARAVASATLLSMLLAVCTSLILGRVLSAALCASRTIAHLRLSVRVYGSVRWHVELFGFGCPRPQKLPLERFALALVVLGWRCLFLVECGCWKQRGWMTDGAIWPRWMSSVSQNKGGNGMVLPGGAELVGVGLLQRRRTWWCSP